MPGKDLIAPSTSGRHHDEARAKATRCLVDRDLCLPVQEISCYPSLRNILLDTLRNSSICCALRNRAHIMDNTNAQRQARWRQRQKTRSESGEKELAQAQSRIAELESALKQAQRAAPSDVFA